jgi:hypothetical protein
VRRKIGPALEIAWGWVFTFSLIVFTIILIGKEIDGYNKAERNEFYEKAQVQEEGKKRD